MRVFVMDGNTRASLAITRALGREGARVVVGADIHPCLASSSRYCVEKFLYPDPEKDYRAFTSAIARAIKAGKIDILLPVTDITTMMVAENKEEFEKYCSIPFPGHEAVARAANKFALMQLAENLSIPIPETIYADGPERLEQVADRCRSMGYPVVIKPSRSRFRTENGWSNSGVSYANDERELRASLSDALKNNDFPLLVQERIHGTGVGLFLCMDGGETVASFSHKRLREKPPSGGISVLRESIPVDPALKIYSERLLGALNWQGVAMVEFKRDNRAGDYKLMEINGRFWGSLQLAIDAGVNFPSILARIALGEDVKPVHDYKVGVKTRWLWGDVDTLLLLLFKSRRSLNLPPEYPGRLQSLFDFMQFRGKDLHYEVFSRDDIRPWLFESCSRFFNSS